MGHLSSYSKAELRLQPNGGGVSLKGSKAKCGALQPDMERWLCDKCHAEWLKRMQDKESLNES